MKRAWLVCVLLGGCSSSGAQSGVSDAATETPTRTIDTAEAANHDATSEAAAAHQPPDPAGYEYWWSPRCETAGGKCPEDRCFRNQITAIPDRCGTYLQLEVGCVPKDTLLAGWFCTMKKSSGELIYTQVAPIGGEWEECTNTVGNMPPAQGALCVDGGGAG